MNTVYLATPGTTANPVIVGPPSTEIYFNNNTGGDVTAFTLPACVAPKPVPLPIVDLDTIGPYTLTGNPNADGSFTFTDSSPAQAARNGTIRMS